MGDEEQSQPVEHEKRPSSDIMQGWGSIRLSYLIWKIGTRFYIIVRNRKEASPVWRLFRQSPEFKTHFDACEFMLKHAKKHNLREIEVHKEDVKSVR